MHSSSLIFKSCPGPQTLLECYSLIHRLFVYLEIFGYQANALFSFEGVVERVCWHPCPLNDRTPKSISGIEHNPGKLSDWSPTVRKIIGVKNAVEQGRLNNRSHLEIIVHQVEDALLLFGLDRLHHDGLTVRPKPLVRGKRMVGMVPRPQFF